jgi:hypothetical protein
MASDRSAFTLPPQDSLMSSALLAVARRTGWVMIGPLLTLGGLSAAGCGGNQLDFARPQLRPGSDLILPQSDERSLLRALLDPCAWSRDSVSLRARGVMRCGPPALDSVALLNGQRPGTQKIP